ncbi:MAG: transglutaminase-like domain-containing protein [Bacteroidota bacterium]
MENFTEIECKECGQKLRFPSGRHIKFKCPKCLSEYEFDGRIKQKKHKNYIWVWVIIVFVMGCIGLKYYFNNQKDSNDENKSFNESFLKGNETSYSGNDNKENKYQENLNTLIKSVDFQNETTNDFAVRLASYFPGQYNIGQVCQIYDYIVKRWKYVNDSDKLENIRSASRTIKNGLAGDCDDFAVLMAALIESIGGDARISFAYNNDQGHAFTEILATNNRSDMQNIVEEINLLYGTDQFEIHYKFDNNGKCWLNLDWFGEPQHPGGTYFNYTKRTVYYPCVENPYYVNE